MNSSLLLFLTKCPTQYRQTLTQSHTMQFAVHCELSNVSLECSDTQYSAVC